MDDFKVSLLSHNPLLKLPFELLEAGFRPQEACSIWDPQLSINNPFLPDIVDRILGSMCEDVMQRKVATVTPHRSLGTRCAVGLLATIHDANKPWVVQLYDHLYPSGSNIVIDDWVNITEVWTTISIRLLPADPKLSDFPAVVWRTGKCSIHDWQNSRINDWCNYRKYRFIIPRPVPWEYLSIVFTHPLPSNVGIHIGYGEAKWLDKEIGQVIATCLYHRRPVTRGFFPVIFCIYTSSGRGTEGLVWWNTYQRARSSSS